MERHAGVHFYPTIVPIKDRMNRLARDSSTPSDGYTRLGEVPQLQTISMVRTGRGENLSASMSLESLRDRSLSCDKADTIDQGDDIIGVTLATAVKSMTSLEKREASAKPDKKRIAPADPTPCPSAPKDFEENVQVCYNHETWVDATIAAAEEHMDFDINHRTGESVRGNLTFEI
ncbi:MAG: hypothetical protein Q9216_005264 [Gyalolechia sp. 2 TL-2023]